jgi:antitoxin ParD1/3/4
MAAVVEAKVASGEYASDSEVVQDGLRALMARDRVVERWLSDVVVPTCDRIRSGAEATLTASEVRQQLGIEPSATR